MTLSKNFLNSTQNIRTISEKTIKDRKGEPEQDTYLLQHKYF